MRSLKMRSLNIIRRSCAPSPFGVAAAVFVAFGMFFSVASAQEKAGGVESLGAPTRETRPVAELLLHSSSMTPAELKKLALFLGAASYNVTLQDTYITVDAPDGSLAFIGQEFGERAARGEVIRRGLLWNTSNQPVQVRIGEEETVVSIPPGGLFGLGLLTDDDGRALLGGGCSVACGEGTFACCNPGTVSDQPTCVCVPITTVRACQSGGPGSTACSLDQLTVASER